MMVSKFSLGNVLSRGQIGTITSYVHGKPLPPMSMYQPFFNQFLPNTSSIYQGKSTNSIKPASPLDKITK
eukprot:1127816-Pleurochrysis_carterae.AAC.2